MMNNFLLRHKTTFYGIFILVLLISNSVLAQFYVAPSPLGNDNNSGTLTMPFLTLEKARTAMRNSPTIKTTYLRAGIYNRSETFILGAEDNGTTWQRYSEDAWNSVIIDGNSIPDVIDILGGNNITLDGLIIRNYTIRGIGIHGGNASMFWYAPYFNQNHGIAHNNKISNCIIENGVLTGTSYVQAGWTGGGIFVKGSVKNTIITNNLIQNSTGYGIQVQNDISNVEVSNNVVLNVFRGGTCDDGGAIYLIDETQASTNIVIKNNFIRDYGKKGLTAWGIYLDNNVSNVTVLGNVVSGQGGKPVHIHGGRNNVIKGNIFDNQSQLAEVLTYENANSTNAMSGNVFSNNIILYRVNSTFTCFNNPVSTDQFPIIQNNFYKNFGSAPITTSGNFGLADSNPVTGNPLISGSTTYDIEYNSPVFATPIKFPPLVRGWGPSGYTLPADYGTSPSWVNSSVTGMSITPASFFLSVGGKQLIFASILPWNATNQTIGSWNSSNSSVATVNSTGIVTGISAGTATIAAISEDGKITGTCIVTVLPSVSNVAFSKRTSTSTVHNSGLYAGDKAVDGNNLPNVNSRWVSSDKPLLWRSGISNPQWIEIDLGGSHSISAIKFFTGVGYDGFYANPIGDFQFQRWDGTAWVDVFSITGNRDPMFSKSFPSVTTNKVRLYCTFSMDVIRLFEFEVYGVNTITGLENLSYVEKINIYPNPFSEGLVTISLNQDNLNQQYTINIRNLLGTLVYTKTLPAGSEIKEFSLDRSQFNNGLYVVETKSGKQTITTTKLIVK
jgi:parallel beta-helix repeat protein